MKKSLESVKLYEVLLAVLLSVAPGIIAWGSYSPIGVQGVILFVFIWALVLVVGVFLALSLSKVVDSMCE